MRNFSIYPFVCAMAVGATLSASPQSTHPIAERGILTQQAAMQQQTAFEPVPGQSRQELDNPVADPKAVVILGHARFTVLTPQLIRMEWAADGKFEDHASFVFLNRRLPVPNFDTMNSPRRPKLTIKTDALTLTYVLTGDGHSRPKSLHRAHRRRQARHLASRRHRCRKSSGHDAHARRRHRQQDQGAHRATA